MHYEYLVKLQHSKRLTAGCFEDPYSKQHLKALINDLENKVEKLTVMQVSQVQKTKKCNQLGANQPRCTGNTLADKIQY